MLPLYPDFLLSLGMITEKKRTEVSDQIVQAVEKHKNAGKHKEAVEVRLTEAYTSSQI